MSHGEARMTLVEHLAELRSRLTRSAIAIFVGFFVAYAYHAELYAFLTAPVRDALAERGIYRFMATEVMETLFAYIKASMVGSLLLTGPYAIYQLWLFVAPGLLPEERKFLIPIGFFSGVFFLLGASFAYAILLPFITGFMADIAIAEGQVELKITISHAFSFTFAALAVFGAVFELPIAMFFLALFGIATHRSFMRFFRYFIVIAFVVGAILTPPDPISQLMLAIPMIALYGIGILIAWVIARRPVDAAGKRQAIGLALWLAVSGVLVAVAVLIGGVVWAFSPPAPPTAAIPKNTILAVGFSPRQSPVDFAADAAARFLAPPHAEELAAVVMAPGVKHVICVVTEQGDRGWIAEVEDGAGELLLNAARASNLETEELSSAAVALGSSAFVDAVRQCTGEDQQCWANDAAMSRALDALRTEGPAWALAHAEGVAWLAARVPKSAELQDVAGASAVLTPAPDMALAWRLDVGSEAAAAAFRTRLVAWRESVEREERARKSNDAEQAELYALSRAIREAARASELALEAAPAALTQPESAKRAEALATLRQALVALPAAVDAAPPEEMRERWLLDELDASAVRGWSVSQNGQTIELQVDLAPAALRPLLLPGDDAP